MSARSASDAEHAIAVRGVGKQFEDEWVLRDLNFAVPPGTIIGLIGPSGCGKTTTVRMATGVYPPDEGTFSVFDLEPARFTSSQRRDIGYLPQSPVLFEHLSLWENLNFHASLNGLPLRRGHRLRELLELVDLAGEEKKLVRESSGGMRRRVALAATLMHDPRLLVLDEPTAGIDPILRRRFWEHFRALRDDGSTLMIATQYVGEAADCDVVALLAHGRLVAFGAPDDLRRQAFGGEIIDVQFTAPASEEVVSRLGAVEGVQSVELTGLRTARLIVTTAGAVLPRILSTAADAGFSIDNSEEVVPPYDDVFIELVGDGGADETTTNLTRAGA